MGGAVKVWGSALRGRGRPVALVSGPGVTPFVAGLYRMMDGSYLPGYRLPVEKTLGAWELTFRGEDANENENVALCVAALDGAVIPPGEVFSFNDTVGERTEERGFRPGLMYVAGQVVTGMGGGVCIPSTALYNAALKADMEIVERYNHSGPVSYATPGLDAAVVYGMKDLRFRNTSDAPVTLHANLLGNILSISITGKPAPGRRVVVERTEYSPLTFSEVQTPDATIPEGTPQVKQEGRAGWTATVVRTVYQGDKVLRRETVSEDTVAPRSRVLLVNPLDIPDSPESQAAADAALATATAEAEKTAPVAPSPSAQHALAGKQEPAKKDPAPAAAHKTEKPAPHATESEPPAAPAAEPKEPAATPKPPSVKAAPTVEHAAPDATALHSDS